MSQLSFKSHTVVVTGAGGGLGKAYSLFYASRGANVVVNDVSQAAAQKVVDEITKSGGRAVVNTASVADGEAVIKTALDAFGGVTILINNAGILRDKGFKNMTDAEWDQIQLVHLKGSFSCSRAAWPIFVKQRFGRIVNTASAAGLYGNFGQANYSAAKMGLVAFTKALALEGANHGIKAVVIAPMAASAMTETIMPPEMLANLKPEYVAPFVATVTHPEGPDASGRIFEVGAGFIAEVRWERSKGNVFKTDASFTPSAVRVQTKWDEITDFDEPQYPTSIPDFDPQAIVAAGSKLSSNEQVSPEVRFDGKTVIVTGAGAGIGRACALSYAQLGANVVVNDVSKDAAEAVVAVITKAGGKAVAAVLSAEDGDGIVKIALDTFGGVHVLVANAAVVRPNAFHKMTDKDWDEVITVNLRGAFKCAKAVWPIFQKQKFGRIVTMGSQAGIYGLSGLVNYSTAKAAVISLTRTLAIEGQKYNILCNVVVPSAGNMVGLGRNSKIDAIKEEYVAPIVEYLSSEANEEITGGIFQVAAGWIAQLRWQRTGGHGFPVTKPLTPEAIISKWDRITNFTDGRATNPSSTQEAFMQIAENFGNEADDSSNSSGSGSSYADPEDSELVAEAKKNIEEPLEYTYTERDVILYNLGIGATERELQWTFEGHDEFAPIPTFGVIPQLVASASISLDWLPNYNPAKLLHGEQYLAIKGPIPTSGTFVSHARLMEVLDKGKAAAVTSIVETVDKATGKVVFESQSTVFIRGSGGFGGKRIGRDRGAASAANSPPQRKPDAVLEEKTFPSQAALYRLSGDYNPLHILPEFAAVGGFDKPILHGLCSFGISGKHILKTFGPFSDIKVRFAGVVYPGETLVTEMWQEGDKVIFTTKVKERGAVVLAAAAATLANPGSSSAKAKL